MKISPIFSSARPGIYGIPPKRLSVPPGQRRRRPVHRLFRGVCYFFDTYFLQNIPNFCRISIKSVKSALKKYAAFLHPLSVTILLPFDSYLHLFPSILGMFLRKVGDITPLLRRKLDKSGKQVYTSGSFSIGNKSYKLFFLSFHSRIIFPKAGKNWIERSFQEV